MARQSEAAVVAAVTPLCLPLAEQLGLEIWDIEFKREGSEYFLRVFLDKEGGVSIQDCEAFSRALDPMLDEADPIDSSYCLEVSSAGIDRPLRRDSDYLRFLGSRVEVHFYAAPEGAPRAGQKIWEGILSAYENGTLTLTLDDGSELVVPRDKRSLCRLAVTF